MAAQLTGQEQPETVAADNQRDSRPELSPPCLLLLATLTAAAVAQGGYYPTGHILIGVLLAVTLGVAVGANRLLPGLRLIAPAAVGAAGLAVAVVGAGLADGDPGGAIGPVALLVGTVGAAAVVASAPRAERRLVVGAVTMVGAVVGLSGWVGVVGRIGRLAQVDGDLWRASTTITYANASAGVLVLLATVALARCVEDARPGTRLTLTALLVGAGATLSRAGGIGLLVGLVALCILLGPGRVIRSGGRSILGAVLALAALAPGMSSTGPGHPLLAVVGLGAGLAVAAAPRPGRGQAGRDGTGSDRRRNGTAAAPGRRRAVPRRVTAVALTGAGALTLLAVVVLPGQASPNSWSGRLSAASPDRSAETRAALHLVADHPITGVGPGRALLAWTSPTRGPLVDHYAHDEYLQTAVEDGIVGLVGLGALVAGIVVVGRRGIRSDPGAVPVVAAGAVAALTGLAVECGFDFLLHVPVLPLLAAVVVALATPPRAALLLPPGNRLLARFTATSTAAPTPTTPPLEEHP